MCPVHVLALAVAALLGLFGGGLAQSISKGVYGVDDRTDESQSTSCVGETCDSSGLPAEILSVAASTVAMVPRQNLRYDVDTNTWVPTTAQTLQGAMGLCHTDSTTGEVPRFGDQPVPSSCSGTVVQWDSATGTGLVATAGHCHDTVSESNGCQTSSGGIHQLPLREGACQFSGDGECDDGIGADNALCPLGTDDDCLTPATEQETCKFLFVFDFTDEVLNETGPPPPPDACNWANDGACDVPTYCSAGDSCDCSGIDCPAPSPPPYSIPAANVYDCTEVVMCDVESVPSSWAVDGVTGGGSFTDYALTRIVATGISSVTLGCSWEGDGECDVPNYCPAGTDTVDCSTEDTEAFRVARTLDYSNLTRDVLDAGSPRMILPAPLFAGTVAQGTSLTVIGHPSGLPRKYAPGASVLDIAECQNEAMCPESGADWSAYHTNADTFGGNSGSGVFTDSGVMVAVLISGATDYVYQIADWGGQDNACREVARCEGISSTTCRLYDTSLEFPTTCAYDSSSDECNAACEGPGLQRQSCGGENLASVADIIRYLERHFANSSTYQVVRHESDLDLPQDIVITGQCTGNTDSSSDVDCSATNQANNDDYATAAGTDAASCCQDIGITGTTLDEDNVPAHSDSLGMVSSISPALLGVPIYVAVLQHLNSI